MRDFSVRFGSLLPVRAAVAALFLLAAALRSSNAASIYSVQSLAPLGSSLVQVAAINNSGLAVGYMTNPQGNLAAVTFAGGQTQTLSANAIAEGVNDSGLIVGATYSGLNPTVAQWSGGTLTSLGIPGYATSVNNAGQIAGGYITSSNQLHAFVFSNGALNDLGTLGGGWSSAYGINSSGQVAGTSLTGNSVFHAFFATANTISDIGTLGGKNSYGMALNDSGFIVGNSQIAAGFTHAFEWSGSRMTDLGTLGGSQSYAYGINDAGTVVGSSWLSGDQTEHGFVYSDGVLTDLNTLLPLGSGWTIDDAYGVNSLGDILATGTRNKQLYALELAPGADGPAAASFFSATDATAPEPSTLLFVGFGLVGVGIWSRKHLRRA